MENSEKIDISRLLKAQEVFEKFRINMVTDRDKAGSVLAFKSSYEVVLKIMKRFLCQRGVDEASPKETFRHAALEKIIDDPEVWFVFHQLRNLTLHTYNDESLENIVSQFDVFSLELKKLIEKFITLND